MKAFLCWVQVNWPDINFVDPSPPPRGRKKAAGFFDEYVPDSDEEDEDQAVRRNIAEGFYRQPSRSTRSSAAVIPNGSGSRNPRRPRASSSTASVDLETPLPSVCLHVALQLARNSTSIIALVTL